MNKYYFIVPALLLGGFIFLYRASSAEMEIKEAKHKTEIAAKKAADEKQRLDNEKQAQEDAEKRQKEREKEELAKLQKKEKEYNDIMTRLKNESDALDAENAKLTKESSELEIALINGQILRDKTNRESFELNKQVELAKINRRGAELEIQRLIEMVGSKASTSTLAAMPAPPPVPKK
jgi:ABC-type Na+ efflux pump permease subunit